MSLQKGSWQPPSTANDERDALRRMGTALAVAGVVSLAVCAAWVFKILWGAHPLMALVPATIAALILAGSMIRAAG